MAPDLTLHFSPGDTAALPPLIAASACGIPLKHAPFDKSSTALLTSAAPFADASSVLLTGPNGLALHEPLAIARYIASLKDGPFLPAYGAPHHVAVEKWIEWTETTLHPAVVSAVASGKPSDLSSDLLEELAVGAKGSEGKELTLADVAVFWRLVPVLGGPDAKPSKIAERFGFTVASQHVAPAIKSVLAGQNPQTLADASRKAIAASLAAAAASPKPSRPQTSAEAPKPSAAKSAAKKESKTASSAETPGSATTTSATNASGTKMDAARASVTKASDTKAAAKPESKGPVKAGAGESSVVITDPGSPYLEVTGPPRAPVKGKRNVLVTSALPYVNNVPHLGNIIGSVLSADVYARYCRRRGYNVIYMCGTDEYGTATENKALEEGLTPREICDKYHVIHRDIYKWFDISFDHFGRTSTPQQTDIAQSIFRSLLDKNRLIEDTMEQLYCDQDKKFLADRFVEGTCPNCQYEDARGDQCDKCQKLLNPTDLINPRCKICGTTPHIRSTEHLFLDLPTLKPQLEEYIDRTSGVGEWSANSIATTASWIRDGLKPRCITRDLKWGVPVPLEKYKEKVFYVWFDAPIGYISITANYTDTWQEWWHSPDDVELVQFMGKDNVPFHTVIFPSTLLGTAEPWTLMKTISVTEYLNYEDGKFSKSRGVGVFGNDAQSTGVPSEVWRYYLLVNRPEVSDTVFTWGDLQAKNNSELLANLGNFVNRGLKFLADRLDGTIPDAKGAPNNPAIVALGKEVQENVREYVGKLEKVKLKDGLKIAMNVSALGNKFFQDTKPWVLLKTDKAACEDVVATAAGLVKLLATLLEPYMPAFAHKVLKQLNLPPSSLSLTDADVELTSELWKLIPAGHKIGVPVPLFRDMLDDEVASNKKKFAGSQADRKAADSAAASSSSTGPATPAAKDGKSKKGQDKGGKEAKGGSSKGAKEAEKPVDVSRLDIRVGKIVSVKKHPEADSLYVEEIDVGEATPRTVISGLVKHIPIEGMQDQIILTVCNLKPAAMRGVKSHAMVLCASDAEKTKIEFVRPPEGAKIGERVTFPAYPGEPDEQLNPKKKVYEAVQPGFSTTDELVATWKGEPFTTSAGVCKATTIRGGSIS